MIDFPCLFLAPIRLHSYSAFIRERHRALTLHPEARAGADRGTRAARLPQSEGRQAQHLAESELGILAMPRAARQGGQMTCPDRRAHLLGLEG